jgi:uncharacterized peroxidase-related enzyme
MSWIETIPVDQSAGAVKDFYNALLKENGFVPNILQVLSLKPDSLLALAKLRETLATGGSSLGRRKEELINVVVSTMNQCRHCMHSHGEALRTIAGDVSGEVVRDWRTAKLSGQEYALLQFCEKVTLFRNQMSRSDVDSLRAAGYGDREILEIVLATAYRHFMNIVADALGVEDEPILRQAKESES